jgi:hypothetical protein
MNMMTFGTYLLLSCMALLVICMLLCKKPAVFATMLACESILIGVFLGYNNGFDSPSLGTSILLCFFSFILAGIVYYFDSSFNVPPQKTSKATVIIGAVIIIISIINFDKIYTTLHKSALVESNIAEYSIFNLIICGFSLLCILLSSLIIFQLKHSRTED